jgi:hypothetical protein
MCYACVLRTSVCNAKCGDRGPLPSEGDVLADIRPTNELRTVKASFGVGDVTPPRPTAPRYCPDPPSTGMRPRATLVRRPRGARGLNLRRGAKAHSDDGSRRDRRRSLSGPGNPSPTAKRMRRSLVAFWPSVFTATAISGPGDNRTGAKVGVLADISAVERCYRDQGDRLWWCGVRVQCRIGRHDVR